MSYISASRMPHAYADPAAEAETSLRDAIKREARQAGDFLGLVSRGTWLLGAIGVGAAGAALYAALRPGAPRPRKRRAPGRRTGARRVRAAA